jgi:MYXO-CTERM domain-containing protein
MRIASISALLLSSLTLSTPALAFCRTTTCRAGECVRSKECESCLVGGRPLFWRSRCLSFAVDEQGSAQQGIDAATARSLIAGAFEKWTSVDCGGQHPSLSMLDLGNVSCNATGYDSEGGNINLWTFRDGAWPHGRNSSMLALTTVTFDADTGEILDADVEINSSEPALTVGDSEVAADLDSVVTHESGHFLGLSHSCETGATMLASYPVGSTAMRSLEPDDAAGLCSAFPPGLHKQCDPKPKGGLSACTSGKPFDPAGSPACSVHPGSGGSPALPALFALVVFGLLRRHDRCVGGNGRVR